MMYNEVNGKNYSTTVL